MKNGTCCLCGLPYTRHGNNPIPLASIGRCCDACDEVVIQARIYPAAMAEEIERVRDAIFRKPFDDLHQITLAAICASRGPDLWAEKQRMLAALRSELNDGPDDDGE